MSDFILVSREELKKLPPKRLAESITKKEMAMMHLSALSEILKGNKSDLNVALYEMTKRHVNNMVTEISNEIEDAKRKNQNETKHTQKDLMGMINTIARC